MRNNFKIIFLFLLFSISIHSQNWTLELKSYVEYRTWSLTTKAVSKETALQGATIKLFQGSTLVSQVTSDADGEFTLLVPPNGEFIGEVSFPGCNAKRFSVSTTGVPEKVGDNDYKPTFAIKGGFVMVKPYPSIDYSNLEKSLIRVSYLPSLKNFDNEEAATQTGLGLVGQVYDAENILFERFCAKNREGDAALKIPDCPLARKLYNEAIAIIPNEEYPVEQLKKVGACLKEIEEAEKKAKEAAEAKEKARLDQLAKDKALAEENSKKNEAKEKENQEKILKAEADKQAAAKLAAEKAEADKIAKSEAAKLKADLKETEKQKAEADKQAAAKLATEKAEADKIAKQKNAENAANINKTKKQAEEDEAVKKKKADEDEIARKKRQAEDDEAARKRNGEAKTDLIKGKQTGKTDVIVGGKKPSTPDEGEMDATGTKHRPVRKMIGTDQYKADMAKANDLFKRKRYEEAKPVYESALLAKPDDPTAKAKLAEIEKLLNK
jgi:hypothetical protein